MFLKRNPAYFFSESQETTFSDPTPFLPMYPRTIYAQYQQRALEKAFRMDMKYTYLLMKHSLSERGIATLHVSKETRRTFSLSPRRQLFLTLPPFLPPPPYTHVIIVYAQINRGLGVYLEKAFRMDMKYTYLLMKHSFSERGIATLHVSEKKPGVLFL